MSAQTMSTKQSTVQRTKQTISYSNFDVNKLVVQPLEDNKLNTAQKLAMVRYKHDQYSEGLCQIQSHNCKLFTYGIPRAGPYYATDKARAFVKVPEDVNDPKSVTFFNKLESIDTLMQSTEFKKKLFGSDKVANLYKYQPIVRVAEEREDDDEEVVEQTPKKNYGPRPRYMKVKVDLDWESSAVKTKCFVKDETGARIPVTDVSTLDELNKYVRYQSTICMVMILNKVYASKAKVNGESKKYGATFKLSQVVCEPPSNSYSGQDEDAFIDDEDNSTQLSGLKINTDEDDDVQTLTLNESSVKVNLASALDNEEEDEEDEDEEEDEEEVIEAPKVVAAPPAKAPASKRGKK